MLNGGLDATILLENPPEVEVIDGLFYVTDRIGGLVIRRCFRPAAFIKAVRQCQKLAAEWQLGSTSVVQIRAAG